MKNIKGFTLIEVLVSIVIATAILAPLSVWFYNSGGHQISRKKHEAIHLAQFFLNRAYLEGWTRTKEISDNRIKNCRLKMDVITIGNEIQYRAQILSKSDKEITTLVLSRFIPETESNGKKNQ